MKNWSLLLLVLAAAGLAAFLLTRGSPSHPAGGLEPDDAGAPPSAASGAAELPPGEVPGAAEPVAPSGASKPPASDAGASLVTAENTDPKVLFALRDWELRQVALGEQYGGLGAAELREQLARVEGEIADQRKVLFGDRFNRGIYGIEVPGGFPLNPPEPGPRGRVPLQETRTATDLEKGIMEAHIATLPIEEYPDFYDLLDERDWLKGEIEP